MAASDNNSTTLATGSGYKFTLTIAFSEISHNNSNNTSEVTATATFGSSTVSFAQYSNRYLSIEWYDNNDNSSGTQVISSAVTEAGQSYGTKTVTKTFTVSHKSDGSLSGYAKAVWTSSSQTNLCPASGSVSTSWSNFTTSPSYTISYNANGGTTTPSNQTKRSWSNLTISGAIGHNSTTQDGFTVTFNANGGTANPSSKTAQNTISYPSGAFTGWKSSATEATWGAGATNFNENNNTTLTAQWNPTTTRGSITLLTDAECTRTNYTLLGFDESSTAITPTYEKGISYTPTENKILYAIWKRNQASIKIKTGASTWEDGLVWVKTNNGWERVLKVYTKTDSTTWTESNN